MKVLSAIIFLVIALATTNGFGANHIAAKSIEHSIQKAITSK
ncbi:Uncharacterised protein [Campylobacter hyointestinalis subsp. hyointestinalis]|uniref:Uncharacterized protein n=1 Tax=Campylobacter hyointestinalis subsp. hyointestinalis TaxID=91352 RepID=A0A0S4ST83_CAMHY|nr:hypothetical protein [Campylobacter hyointestinalis]CUU89650.1 Uncharacterised protein [Campylobacter hyointestinalis subsp. hyointestinalis]